MTTEAEPVRNDAGRFTPDTSNMFGAELANAEAGFRTRPRDPAPDEISSDPSDLKAAAADLVAKRAQPLEIQPDDVKAALGGPDVTEAVTPEQAAQDIANRRQEASKFIDGYNIERVADQIDAKRAEELKVNPRAADDLGLSAQDVEAARKVDLPDSAKAAPSDPTAAAIDGMDGLDPETKQALKNPQVRQALEQEFTRIDQARQQYTEAVSSAHKWGQAGLLAIAPELQSVPLDRWQEGIQIIAQADPARGQQLANAFEYVQAAQQEQASLQRHQAQVQRQQFEAARQQYSRASDEALGPMTMAEKAEMAEELVSLVAEYGISREQFAAEAESNLALHHPAFQKMAADAIRYQRLVKAPKAVPQALPAVQRPGVQRDGPRPGDNSSKIQSLQRQLAGANGATAVRIAGQIRSLKRG